MSKKQFSDLPVPQEFADQLSTLDSEDDTRSAVSPWEADRAEHARRVALLRQQARSVARAFDAWSVIRSDEEWLAVVDQARRDYEEGRFLLERLGGERFLDPVTMATIWTLRQYLIQDLDVRAAHEYMLVDVVILSYYRLLDLNLLVGNLTASVETEFFGQPAPSAKFKEVHGRQVAVGLEVEATVERLGQSMLPLMERCSKMMTRALRTLTDLRRAPAPNVAIGQVNVAAVQRNHATGIPSSAHLTPPSSLINAALTDEA
jgi:hypothetical protein